MKPGPELDRLMAESVMGWHVVTVGDTVLRHVWATSDGDFTDWHSSRDPDVSAGDAFEWKPSEEIAAAWEVVEKLRLCIAPESSGGWMASTHSYFVEWETASAETAPHAICLAALMACGIEFPKEAS